MLKYTESDIICVWTDILSEAYANPPEAFGDVPTRSQSAGYGPGHGPPTPRRRANKKEAKGRRIHKKTLFDDGKARRRTSLKPSQYIKKVLPNVTAISPSRKAAKDALRIAGLSSHDVESLSKEIEI